jgi:polyhydroxyalkanoate synthesis regulator phasin
MANVSAWRQQEQDLLERWQAATERHRKAHAELAAATQANGSPNDALVAEVKAASAELEALRRQVARLKRDFLTGKRY